MIYPVRKSVSSYLIIPFLCVLLFTGVFALVWLRSNIVSIEYRIGEVEKGKFEAVRETKALEAEMAALLSMQETVARLTDEEFVSPERKKVVHVKRDKGGAPYTASFRGN